MGGSKGGSSDSSGMYTALASAQAAQTSYQLGQQQLDWAKQVWNQEQPYITQAVSTDIATQQQQAAFSQEQEQLYQQTYQPLEQSYAQQSQQWASPGQQSINAGAAMTNVNEAAEAQRTSAQQQLESYGINPGSTRFAGLDIGSRTAQAAAAAGAGTTAVQATKLQGLGLEAGVVNTGRGLSNAVANLASTGVGAGTAGTGAAQSNLSTGSSAMTAPANWFNTGAANMGVYTNAVNSYNQSQLGYAQVGAMQSAGLGSLAGGLLGMLDKGGNVGATQGVIPNSQVIPQGGTPGGYVPPHTSPSAGHVVDDVPARLTVGEFVIPKDVVSWEGQKAMYSIIDKARQGKDAAQQRTDIGGEAGHAPPLSPTFSSVIPPQHARAS